MLLARRLAAILIASLALFTGLAPATHALGQATKTLISVHGVSTNRALSLHRRAEATYRFYRIHVRCTAVEGCGSAHATYWSATIGRDTFTVAKVVPGGVVVARVFTRDDTRPRRFCLLRVFTRESSRKCWGTAP